MTGGFWKTRVSVRQKKQIQKDILKKKTTSPKLRKFHPKVLLFRFFKVGSFSFLLNLKGLVSHGVETANRRPSLSMDPERSKRNLREGKVGKQPHGWTPLRHHRVFFSVLMGEKSHKSTGKKNAKVVVFKLVQVFFCV